MQDLAFQVLGPVQVLRDGNPVAVAGRKPLALLTGLLLSANETVPVSAMIDWAWGEKLPDHPRAALHNVVSRLRHRLDPGLIDVTPTGYRLNTDPEHLDRLEFDHFVTGASALIRRNRPQEAAAQLAKALALWREPLLGNVDSPALHRDEAGQLTERYLDTLERHGRLCMELGWYAAVVEHLADPVRTHPFREPLTGLLMLALLRGGRRADALAAYDRLRCALRDELGADPSPELQRIHLDVLRTGPQSPDSPPRATTVVTGRPQGGRPARELPTVAGRLHGREQELRTLGSWLGGGNGEQPAPALVAIVGPAGVGKSALAVRGALAALDRFPDGRLYVNLRGYDNDGPMTVGAALSLLLSALTSAQDLMPGDEQSRAALYRSLAAGRRMLVILDNARDAGQVRPLLPGAEAACTTIVTSRNQLRGLVAREGAQRIILDGIAPHAAQELLAELAALGPDTPAAVLAGLADRCAGLPLAVRILAERLTRDGHRPGDLLHELRGHSLPLDLFDPGGGDAGLRVALTGSYRALDDGAARAYRRLAGHGGPSLSLSDAAGLLGESEPDSRRLLDRLVSVHLLDQRGPSRYWFTDLIQAHARECSDRYASSAGAETSG